MQLYLMWTGVVVAYIFTSIPEWTTWVMLVAMALYDLFAVLTPNGPLQMLVNLAIERDQDIPALVYEAREVRRRGRGRRRHRANQTHNGATAQQPATVDDTADGGTVLSEPPPPAVLAGADALAARQVRARGASEDAQGGLARGVAVIGAPHGSETRQAGAVGEAREARRDMELLDLAEVSTLCCRAVNT